MMVTTIVDSIMHGDPILLFVPAVTFVVMGLLMTLIYRSKLKDDRKSRDWPSVQGKVTTSRVEERAGARRSGSASRTTIYVPVIKYSYTVNETLYHSDRIGNGIYQSFTRFGVNSWVKRYPVKSDVIVYYNPENPADGLLERTSSSNVTGLLVGLGMDLLGVVVVGLWIYRLTKG